MEKYNGYTNYATWRIMLEVFSNMELQDFTEDTDIGVSELKDILSEYLDEVLASNTRDSANNLVLDYANAFVSQVNFYEIAEHIIEDSKE